MELIPAVVVAVAAMLAAAVCVRRATLGDQMDSSLEELRLRPGRPAPRHVVTPVVGVPKTVSRQPVPLGLIRDNERIPVAAMVATPPFDSQVRRAS
jgi:hypothetical protein